MCHVIASEGVPGLKAKIAGIRSGRGDSRDGRSPDDATSVTSLNPQTDHDFRYGSVRRELMPGALLLGHPYGVYGIGEHVRLSAAAFAAARVPFGICNVYGEDGYHGVHLAGIHQDFTLRDRISHEGWYRANIFHINADEMVKAFEHLGEDCIADRYNIGYWAWELSHFPEAWSAALRLVDEVWAPSRFIEQAIAHSTSSPVMRMPLAVEFPEPKGLTREYFGLPEEKFLFLFFFDFTSYIQRKNPGGALRAFLQAFPDPGDQRVALVIKMKGMEICPGEFQTFLQQIDQEDPRIILLETVLTDRETKALVQLCDCFLSLHRSEGFGRGLAEAMYLGKPVIATGYSGNMDFTNDQNACLVDYQLIPVLDHEYPFGTGQKWADPDLDHATWFIRRVVNEPQYAHTIGRLAEDFIRTHHSAQAVGAKYRARLAALKMV